MKKIIVWLFLICTTFAEWQEIDKINLPKGIQINDLSIDNTGELWVLSTSSVLKLEPRSKSPFLVQEFLNGKLFSVFGETIFLVNNSNKLCIANITEENVGQVLGVVLNDPKQVNTIAHDGKPIVMLLDQNRLLFVEEGKVRGSIIVDAEKFVLVPLADYNSPHTPFFTLWNNQVYSWTEGTYRNLDKYQKQILYSSSGKILDLAAGRNNNLYLLFSDSIVVLKNSGEYQGKIWIDNLTGGSRILTNPANNNLVIFNPREKSFTILSEAKIETGDIISLGKNRPNPVDNYTEIEFTINQPLQLTLTVYNLIGELVKIIAKGQFPAGTHRVIWDARDEKSNLVPNGVYFYRLESKKGAAIKQLIVLR